MTAFAILGSSGQAYRQGIGIYGLMASSSCFVIPLTIFFIGTRLWAIGKKFGHQTQVSYFRGRWECSHIGTLIFILTIVMLLPYMIVSLMGGGTVLRDISGGRIPYWLGCGIVGLVVTLNVFLGGMRGTVWVNVLQTIMFLCFGSIALIVISSQLPGGFSDYIQKIAGNDKTRFLLTRERMGPEYFWSYSLIPLSSIMFPHMAIMCFSARRMTAFKRTVILYPLAIMAIWLPCIFLGVIGTQAVPGLKPADADGVLLKMLSTYAPAWLAGLLGAGIISAVMGSDTHQVLGASTMFTKDIFVHYGGHEKFGEKASVHLGRIFILLITAFAYFVAVNAKLNIFDLAVRFAFSGFAAMAPVMVAALFWKRSTKWGALAATLWVGATLAGSWWLQAISDPTAPKPGQPAAPIFASLGHWLERNAGGVLVHGYLPVAPMILGSAVCVIVFSLLTPPPSQTTISKYFDL
jgi:solute:Na+ symporter, SSS family